MRKCNRHRANSHIIYYYFKYPVLYTRVTKIPLLFLFRLVHYVFPLLSVVNDPVDYFSRGKLYSLAPVRFPIRPENRVVLGITRRDRQYFARARSARGARSILFNIKNSLPPRTGQCVSLSQLSTWTSTPIDTPKDSRIVPSRLAFSLRSLSSPLALCVRVLSTSQPN